MYLFWLHIMFVTALYCIYLFGHICILARSSLCHSSQWGLVWNINISSQLTHICWATPLVWRKRNSSFHLELKDTPLTQTTCPYPFNYVKSLTCTSLTKAMSACLWSLLDYLFNKKWRLISTHTGQVHVVHQHFD